MKFQAKLRLSSSTPFFHWSANLQVLAMSNVFYCFTCLSTQDHFSLDGMRCCPQSPKLHIWCVHWRVDQIWFLWAWLGGLVRQAVDGLLSWLCRPRESLDHVQGHLPATTIGAKALATKRMGGSHPRQSTTGRKVAGSNLGKVFLVRGSPTNLWLDRQITFKRCQLNTPPRNGWEAAAINFKKGAESRVKV